MYELFINKLFYFLVLSSFLALTSYLSTISIIFSLFISSIIQTKPQSIHVDLGPSKRGKLTRFKFPQEI